MESENLTFDVAIVTRNRLDALTMSVPLMLSQSRQPKNFIVIDSSDDHSPIKSLIEKLTSGWDGNVEIHHSSPGICTQRNRALQYVQSDVVFFPDDDSLWHENFVEHVMKAYEADIDKTIGAVGGRPVTDSPLAEDKLAYHKSKKGLFKLLVQPLRNKIEEAIFPKPFNLYAEEKQASLKILPWMAQQDVIYVPNISGFRMSFRSSVLKTFGFDELLNAKVGYAPHEDMEVSAHIWRSGYSVVAARNALVFHHMHPSQRAPAYSYGFAQILNYAYIVAKHMDGSSKARQAARPFLFYKVLLYRFGMNKNVYRGGMDAWKASKALFSCETEKLTETYLSVYDEYLPS